MTAQQALIARLGLKETRADFRIPVTLTGNLVSSETRRHTAELSDISERGCRIASPTILSRGSAVILRIEHLAPVLAIVRWCSASDLGLEFTRKLDPRVIRQLIDRAAAARGKPAKTEN